MSVPEQPLLPPWRLVNSWAVGGLIAVGYAPNTDMLLAGSGTGLGVFDCLTGSRLARNHESDGYPEARTLLFDGFGPLDGQKIRAAGLGGGGLPLSAGDGIWHLELEPAIYAGTSDYYKGRPCWQITLIDGRSWVGRESRHLRTCMLYHYLDFRAAGFSETGRSFVIATSDTLYMFAQE
ncbi:hypothetical protein [Armatimonas sp.]|uniref:hypothetical protein n=1 Tax=Armatimonas sp. TaxID=1872638 RepID=UPI00374C9B97